jgi:hypothetical protein
MDPLSVTASIIAVIGTARQITKNLQKIHILHDAPSELHALMNDVVDFQAVLGDVDAVLGARNEGIDLP